MKRTVRQNVPKRKSAAAPETMSPAMPRLDLSTVDVRVALLQALIPIALDHVGELLAEEVASLAGDRYARNDGAPARVRWGQQRGSIYLGHQQVGIAVPRVRDRATNTEVGLQTYAALQQPRTVDEALLRTILGGVSTREYGGGVGVWVTGEKRILGFVQTATENRDVFGARRGPALPLAQARNRRPVSAAAASTGHPPQAPGGLRTADL